MSIVDDIEEMRKNKTDDIQIIWHNKVYKGTHNEILVEMLKDYEENPYLTNEDIRILKIYGGKNE